MGKFTRGNLGAAKLTPQQVLEIRERYNEGWTQGRLAREYQRSVVQIGRIVRGEVWQRYNQPSHPQEIEHSEAMLKLDTAVPIDMDPETKARLAVELAADMAASQAGAAASPLDSLPPALAAKAAFYTSGAKPPVEDNQETHDVDQAETAKGTQTHTGSPSDHQADEKAEGDVPASGQ